MDFLRRAAACYAKCAKLQPKEASHHFRLGAVTEEQYHLEDIYLPPKVGLGTECK